MQLQPEDQQCPCRHRGHCRRGRWTQRCMWTLSWGRRIAPDWAPEEPCRRRMKKVDPDMAGSGRRGPRSGHAGTATAQQGLRPLGGGIPFVPHCRHRRSSTVARRHLPDLRGRSSLSKKSPCRRRPSRPADYRGAAQAAARPREGWGGAGGGWLGHLPYRPGRRATRGSTLKLGAYHI